MVAKVGMLRGVIHPVRIKWKNAHQRELPEKTSWPRPGVLSDVARGECLAAAAVVRWCRRLGGRAIKKASAFEEACQFLSSYLEMERPGYTTRDVLAGIERLQAVTGEGDGKRARWYIERARCRLAGTPHKDNRWR